ncbi:MAG: hypothetical protein WCD18_15980 [Thermosynechococcaceae cyanobacterium]
MLKTQTQYTVMIASNASTGNDAVDTMLQQIYPGKSYLTQSLNNSLNAQQWIGESLYVEISKNLDTGLTYITQFCLSVEFTFTSAEELQLTFVTAWKLPGTATIEIQTYPQRNSPTPLYLETIDSYDIQLQFANSFESFEARLSAQVANLEAYQDLDSSNTSCNFDQLFPLEELEQLTFNEGFPEAVKNPESTQNTLTLQQKIKKISEELSPFGFPIFSKLNASITTPALIKTIQNYAGQKTDLVLEYSPSIDEPELIEYLRRLGHYQSFKYLAHLHLFVQEDMQILLKQNGQPSLGAIAPYLQKAMTKFSEQLQERIQFLTHSQLQSLTAQDLQAELKNLRLQHQQQQPGFLTSGLRVDY